MDQHHSTGSSRLDFLLLLQSYLAIGLTFVDMQDILKIGVMGSAVILNLFGIHKYWAENRKSKNKKP